MKDDPIADTEDQGQGEEEEHDEEEETLAVDMYRFLKNFTKFFVTQDGLDVCALVHDNGICILTVSPTDWLGKVKEQHAQGTLSKFTATYYVQAKENVAARQLKKQRRNGDNSFIQVGTKLVCYAANDEEKVLRSPLKGKLMETNDRLINKPEIIFDRWYREGWAIIMFLKEQDVPKHGDRFLSPEKFAELRHIGTPFVAPLNSNGNT